MINKNTLEPLNESYEQLKLTLEKAKDPKLESSKTAINAKQQNLNILQEESLTLENNNLQTNKKPLNKTILKASKTSVEEFPLKKQNGNKSQTLQAMNLEGASKTIQEELPTSPLNNNLENAETSKYKKLGFWVGVTCFLVVLINVLLGAFGINFQTKVIIEVVSYFLAMLVSIGVLVTSNKTTSVTELKDNIEETLNKTTTELTNKVNSTLKQNNKSNKK